MSFFQRRFVILAASFHALLLMFCISWVSAFVSPCRVVLSTRTTTTITTTTKTKTWRLDTRRFGLFGNQKKYQSLSSSPSTSPSSLTNSTDSHNTPQNSHQGEDEPSLTTSNNTSTAVLEHPTESKVEKVQDAVVPSPLPEPPIANGKTNGEQANGKVNGEQVNGKANGVKANGSRQVPPFFREGTNNPSGIGGQGGVTYNVNALKRNLLQETVRAYKMELLALLQSPSATEDAICQKLAALVQASPVRTTTDSNLLQAGGVRWTLCYKSKFSTVAHLRQPPQPLVRNNQKMAAARRNNGNKKNEAQPSPAQRRVAGKELTFTRSMQRSFHLESLHDNQEPYVVDHESYWGGLIRLQRTFRIKALTRTCLNLQLISSKRWVFGRLQEQSTTTVLPRNSASPISANLPTDMTIIYSDTDLCIIADPQQKTYQVYTQAEAWESTQFMRQIRFTLSSLWYRLSHFGSNSAKRRERSNARLLRELQLHQDLLDEESRLIVWQLGAGDDDEEAWESRTDPFVHLSADDRQRILKAMSVRQVQQAAQEYATYQKRTRFLNWWPRRTHFKRPKQDESERRRTDFRRPQP